MSENTGSTRQRWNRTVIVIAVSAALALAGVGISTAFSSSADETPPTAQPPAPSVNRESPQSPGKAEGAGVLSTRNAESIIDYVVNTETTESEGPDALKERLTGIVEGAFLAELQNQQQELEAYDWKITGDATVASVKVGKIDTRKAQAKVKVKVEACIDLSGTKTIDAEGHTLLKASGPSRAKSIFRLVQNADGTWTVIDRTFPDDPAC